jgi:hypothetical protein
VNYDEIRVSDERRHPLGDSRVNTRFTSELLFSVWKFSERLAASRVGAENGICRIVSSTPRANYQVRARMLSLVTIDSPLSLSRYDIKHADVRDCKRDHDHAAPERHWQQVRRVRSVSRDEIDPLVERQAEPCSERTRCNIEEEGPAWKQRERNAAGDNQQEAREQMVDIMSEHVEIRLGRHMERRAQKHERGNYGNHENARAARVHRPVNMTPVATGFQNPGATGIP